MDPSTQRRVGLLALLTLFLTPAQVPGAPLALAPGDRAPMLTGKLLSGERVDVVFDRVTVVNFWATWCEPCIREMPALEGLFRSRSADDLQVVGVVRDSVANEELVAFVQRLGVTYPVIRPHRRTSGFWGGVATLPVTFLIDGQGTVLRRYVGATPEQIDALVSDVEAVLDDRPLGPMVIPDKPDVATPDDRRKAGS